MKIKIEQEKIEDSKYDKWAVENALETLMRAKEIESDAKMMTLVKEKASEKKAALTSIDGLRKKAQEVRSKPDADLMTEEDKAALQNKKEVDEKLEEMGFEVED
jgi:hypothetical protein